MKLVLLSVDFTPHRDGVSSLSYHYARRLAASGHDVLVVAPRAPGAAEEDAEAPFKTLRFPGYEWGVLRALPFAIASLLALARHRPALVLPMNIGYGGILCYLLRSRYLCFAYAYEFLKVRRHPLLRNLYNRIYARSRFVVAISDFTRRELERFGVSPEKIRIAYPGVALPSETDAETRGPSPHQPPTIGTCGRLIRRKGHDLVIRALPQIRQQLPEARYRIAGRGPEMAALKALAATLGVADAVDFLGELPDAELPAFYRSLDLFTMPSRDSQDDGHAEGFGIVFLEAAREQVPSVATRCGGIPDAILDGQTGVLVEPDNVDALAHALTHLLTHPTEREALARAAHTRVVKELNWDHQVDRVAAWIEETQVQP